jgi:hypothetical protein
MLEVTKAQYQEEYKIWVEFNDGNSGVVDISDALWGTMFEPLKNLDRFKRFAISTTTHTLTWDNGADLAPEYLYDKLVNAGLGSAALSRHS